MRRWKANARGVDLNYNFAANWEGINVSLTHPSANGYKGTNPLSEPESQAIANLIQGTGFNAVINYHAMGNVIYWDTQKRQSPRRWQTLFMP
jgi:g-D-glutamyl-meso-diaminopimelate peptidase